MADQLKKIAFLVPRPGMPEAAFRRYWRGTHGPLVAGSPGYGTWRSRYVQNHVREPGPVGDGWIFAGMAEFWLPGASPNEDTFATTSLYRDRIRVDELNFIDMDRTVSVSALEEVIKPPRGEVKLVVVSRRASGLEPNDFRKQFATEYVDAVLGDRDYGSRVRGWSVNHVIEGSFRLPGARPVPALPIDCIEEIWFESDAEMKAAYNSIGYTRGIRPIAERLFSRAGQSSFVAKEFVFFNRGNAIPHPTKSTPAD